MSNLIKIDNEYKNWITEVSKRFRQTQLKAAQTVDKVRGDAADFSCA